MSPRLAASTDTLPVVAKFDIVTFPVNKPGTTGGPSPKPPERWPVHLSMALMLSWPSGLAMATSGGNGGCS